MLPWQISIMTNVFNGVNEGSDRLKLVKAPVVILQGADDMVVPKAFAELTKNFLGDQAELVLFEGCGHSLITDDLQKYHSEIVKRLN